MERCGSPSSFKSLCDPQCKSTFGSVVVRPMTPGHGVPPTIVPVTLAAASSLAQTCGGVSERYVSSRRATHPATWGAACEVPKHFMLRFTVDSIGQSAGFGETAGNGGGGIAETIPTPGAKMSTQVLPKFDIS